MLTDADRARIRAEEEERARVRREIDAGNAPQQPPPQYTVTDWLSSCILAPIIIVAVIVGLIVLVLFSSAFYGVTRPFGH